MSVISSSNAQEITLNKEAYNNLGEQNNVSNENNLSFVQRHPKKLIAAAIIGGAALKQPAKDLLWGGVVYPLLLRPLDKKTNKAIYEKVFAQKIEEAKYIKHQEGMGWCGIASFQGNLKSLGIDVSQEALYRLLHKGKYYENKQLKEIQLEPAFFEGNRMNMTIGQTDGYIFGLANGNALNTIAKEIDKGLTGANFLVLNENDQKMTPELLEKIVRDIASKMKGWFCISDPITLGIYGMGHAIICKLEGDTLYFENPNIPGAYSSDIKKWCITSSSIINLFIPVQQSLLTSDISFQAFGFTREKIKNQITYTLTNNGGLDIYEH